MASELTAILTFTAFACAACSAAPAGAGPSLALYPGSAEGDAALLRGTLEQDGPCLYIRGDDGGRWLAAFPSPDTRWDAAGRAVYIGGAAVRVGDAAAFGGGERTDGGGPLPWVRPPDPSCDGSRIWMVTQLVGG